MSSSDSENESDTKKKERKKKIQVRGKEVREKNSGESKDISCKNLHATEPKGGMQV